MASRSAAAYGLRPHLDNHSQVDISAFGVCSLLLFVPSAGLEVDTLRGPGPSVDYKTQSPNNGVEAA